MGPKIKARLILKNEDAVGLQAAKNLRRILVRNPIQHHGIDRWLLKNCGLARTDIEGLPVQHRILRDVDRQLRTADGCAGRSAADGKSGWVGAQVEGRSSQSHRENRSE